MALREVLARFGIDFDGAALQRADRGVAGVVDRVKGLHGILAGSAFVGAVLGFTQGLMNVARGAVEMTRELANQADAIRDTSLQLGIGGVELQRWQHAANLSGVENE